MFKRKIKHRLGMINSIFLQLFCWTNVLYYFAIFVFNFIYVSLCDSQPLYPLVIAAHPQEPNQFAVGLTDGCVKVIEPAGSEGKWVVAVPVDNGMQNGRTASSSTTNVTASEQLQR